ncbi:MAG: acyl-CoA thioesterase [Desulfohalobiaceae bacterium]
MTAKPVAASSLTMAHMTLPEDANAAGSVHGGVIMKHIDTAGGVVAMRHARANAVTASIDRLDFHQPVHVGELLILWASVNGVGKSSMEVGVRAEAENLLTGDRRHVASAYITYVALDEERRPTQVPAIIPETEEEKRRHAAYLERREKRLAACREE